MIDDISGRYKQMSLITFLCKRFVVTASVIVLANTSHFIVVEGTPSTDVCNGKMMAAVKLLRRSPRVPAAFLSTSMKTTVMFYDQLSSPHKVIERPLTSSAHQTYHQPTHKSVTSIRMSSVSKASPAEGDVSIITTASLTEDDQTIYNELSALSQKIRSLDESYYGGGEDIVPDEEYDALARREAELCTAFPHLLLRLEEETGLGKEATRFGGRVGQSYKEIDDESPADAVPTKKKTKKKKVSTRSTTKNRQKRKHLENAPMQSLDNAMDTEEVVQWLNRVKKLLLAASTSDVDPDDDSLDMNERSIPITIIAEPKIDGLSLSLRYEFDGKESDEATSVYNFVWGATRGDGKQGEDVSEAVKSAWMKSSVSSDDNEQQFNVPNSFQISTCEHLPPKTIEIRGEVVLPQESFDEFTRNITALDNNKTTTFSNARNAASGILLRSKEPTSEEALEQTKWLQSRLTFYAYDIVASDHERSSSGWLSSKFTENSAKMRDSLSSIGFAVPNPVAMEDIIFSSGIDSVEDDIPSLLDYHRKMLDDRDGAISLPYHIDGVVYKVSSLTDRSVCGSSSRTPRWAIAHKFPPLCGVTRLDGIEIQVGRTGALTPVAILAPVDLGGVMVARASLHNFHYANKILLPSSNNDSSTRVVNKGVEVLVSRAGDVIPQVMKRIFDDDGSATDGVISLEPPKTCPACGSPTTFGFVSSTTRKKSKQTEDVAEEDTQETVANGEPSGNLEGESGQVLRCSGPQLLCQPRAINAMAYAYSRAGLDVKGLSKSKLQQLMDANIIRYPADLFDAFGDSNVKDSSVGREILTKIADLPGWGEISSQNVADSIRTVSAEGVTLSRFIYSLGIPFIGTQASQLLASKFGNVTSFLDALDDASKYENDASSEGDLDNSPFETLSEVKGIGPAALSALLSFSKEEVLVKAAKDLAKALNVHEEIQVEDVSVKDGNESEPSPFEGLTVVFTGNVPNMSRTAARAIVMDKGAKSTPNTVSKSTSLVVEGEKGGKKAKQARDLGIRVITADEFLEMTS